MQRVAILAAAVLALIGLSTPPASAAGGACTEGQAGDAIGCAGDVQATLPSAGVAVGSEGGSGESDANYVPIDRLTTGPDGQTCVGTAYLEAAPGVSISPGTGLDTGNILNQYAPCPGAASAPVVTPAMVAASFWEEVPLPVPRPHIAPGRAITGKWAYLETNGELTHTFTRDTPFGPLEIRATGSYDVDWGDGETTGPYHVEGKPWPDGENKHTYIWVGTYDIVVTERWVAEWRIGDASGTLRQLRTVGRIDDFPVEEIQVVVH